MFRFRYPFVFLSAIAALATALGSKCFADEAQPADPAKPPHAAVEALIKSAGFTYSRRPNGVLEIVAERGAEPLLVWALEGSAFTKKKDNEKVNVAVLFYMLARLEPEQAANPPLDLLRKIDHLNDQLDSGKCVILTGEGSGIYYESSFWLSNATPATLGDALIKAYLDRADLRKAIQEHLHPTTATPPVVARKPPAHNPPSEPAAPAAKPETPTPNAVLEALAKDAGLPCKSNNGFLVIGDNGGNDPLIAASREGVTFTKGDGQPVKIAAIVVRIVPLTPEQAANPPLELMRKINQLNDQIEHGKCLLAHGEKPCIAFESTFELANATGATLYDEMSNAYVNRTFLRERLQEALRPDAKNSPPPANDGAALR